MQHSIFSDNLNIISLSKNFSRLALFLIIALLILLINSESTARNISQFVQNEQMSDRLIRPEWNSVQNINSTSKYYFTWHGTNFKDFESYYQAANLAQGWQTYFTTDGVQVSSLLSDTWSWHLALTSYGYKGEMITVNNSPRITANKETLTYQWDNNLREWWINNPNGLEQGFTLQQKPVTNAQLTPLLIEMDVTSNLTPHQSNGLVAFYNSNGVIELTYDKLQVFDAYGNELPAYLQLLDDGIPRIQIVVDDSQAIYPLTIDPWIESNKLMASDRWQADFFGYSVDISDDTIVVGSIRDNHIEASDAGSAYVFMRQGNSWSTTSEIAKLTASDPSEESNFGASVAIDNDTIVIGAYYDDEKGENAGAIYIFVRPESGWASSTETIKLTASDTTAGDEFGRSVAISGDTIVVGAGADDDGGNVSGSAYVFVRPPGGWATMTETAKLTSSDAAAGDVFGASVAIDGDKIVVGAYGDDDVENFSGSAYVFERPGAGWITATETAKLTASDPRENDNFGNAVAIHKDTIVVGAFAKGLGNSGQNDGAAYVFVQPQSGWYSTTETAKLTASDYDAYINRSIFGNSVAVYNGTIAVGAYMYGVGRGSVYIFERQENGWESMTETTMITYLENGVATYGRSVAINDNTIVFGADNEDLKAGAAHVYTLLNPVIYLPSIIK